MALGAPNQSGIQWTITSIVAALVGTIVSAITITALTTSSITFSGTTGIVGTTTNNNVNTYCVGEYQSSLIATPGSALSTGTALNVTFISLTTGDWDVEGNAAFAMTAATVTATGAGVTVTTATIPTDGSEVNSSAFGVALTAIDGVTLPRKRVSITSTAHTGLTGVAATDVITDVANGYSNGDPVYFTAIAGGAGLVIDTIYYVSSVATDSYKLSATSGGAAIDITTDITSGTIKKGSKVFLVAKSTFTGTGVTAYGSITARRVR